MTQSGVSMVIRRLGQRYGAKLVTQQGKGVVLTDAGVELYRHALATLRSAQLLEERIRALSGKSDGLVALATRPSLSTHFLPSFLVEFWRTRPGVEVRVVDIAPRLVVLREVLTDGVDFAVLPRGGGMVVGPNLVVEPFHREPLVLVAAPDHPLTRVESPTLAEIAQQRFIVSAPETGQLRRLENLFRSAIGSRLEVAMEVGGDGTKVLVREGVGLALMMRCIVEQELARGELRAIPLPNAAPAAELMIVHAPDRQLSEPAEALRALIRDRGAARDGDPTLSSITNS